MPLKADVSVKVACALSKALTDFSPEQVRTVEKAIQLLDGSGDLQATQLYTAKRTLAASANESLDLNGTALENLFGDAVALTKVKALLIIADSANVNDVVFGPAAANGFVTPFNAAADRIKVKPNGFALLVAPDANGYAVTAGTGDLLYVANSGAGSSVTYTIVVIGA